MEMTNSAGLALIRDFSGLLLDRH
ncbi:hypothetical protein MAR_017996 [Mya arenaria]|uniref:Uncharacterized protein n=1 Tax=Mya arenaria TaxID=6604 RepID=A0ABY7EDF9_MYAAR|nr:hypothetical protein MAR_017996 [Mya arenaria]